MTIKIIPMNTDAVSPDSTRFTIMHTDNIFIIGAVSKKVHGWHWHGLGRSGVGQFPSFEKAAKAAQKIFGDEIQFVERG